MVFLGTTIRLWPARPALPAFDEWSTASLTPEQSSRFAVVQINAENQLIACYTDPSEEPEACEQQYVQALDGCSQYYRSVG